MKFTTFFLTAFCICFLNQFTSAKAAGPMPHKVTQTSSPLLIPIAARCVRIMRRGNQETLVNTCSSCKIVGITRKRTGVAMPIQRSFNIHGGTSFAMPFRGPGSSRIMSVQSCQDEAADERDSDKRKTDTNSCLELKQATRGNVVIVNSCGKCRAAVIQRMDRNQVALDRQAYKLKPKGSTAVISKGAAKVSLIADLACPS